LPKPKYKEIDLTNPSDKKDEYGSNPWCMCWCITPENSYLIKGYFRKVYEYIRVSYPVRLYVFKEYNKGRWRYKKPSCDFYFSAGDLAKCSIASPLDRRIIAANGFKRNKYTFYYESPKGEVATFLELRRMPNKWIPEFSRIVKVLNQSLYEKHVKPFLPAEKKWFEDAEEQSPLARALRARVKK